LEPDQPPGQANVLLSGAFEPDPLVVPVMAGGAFNLRSANADNATARQCVGFVNSAPDVVFNLAAPLPYLRLFYLVDAADADATLIMRSPDGRWYCNDDSYNSVHPTLNLVGPEAGNYQVWLGNFDAPDGLSGSLYLTQTDATPLEPEGTHRLGAGVG
jgi:hypothetical protein